MFTEEQAWQVVEELKAMVQQRPVRDALVAMYLCGSLPRGEFDPAHSEVDLLFVARTPDGHAPTDLLVGLQFVKEVDQKWRSTTDRQFPCVDIGPWLFYDSLPLRGSPNTPESKVMWPGFKYVTIYAFDFMKHAQLLFGEDIRDKLVVRAPSQLTYLRLMNTRDRLRTQLQDLNEDWARQEAETGFMVKCSTFEAARSLYLHFGEPTLSKTALIESFDAVIPDFPSKRFFNESLLPEYQDGSYLLRLGLCELLRYFEGCLRFVEDATALVAEKL